MKHPFLILLIHALVVSCSSSNDEGTVAAQEGHEIVEPSDGEGTEMENPVVFDTSDLENLPMDNGGSHVAHLKGSTIAAYGYYVYTPSDYSIDGPEYPLILFLHGWGARGDSRSDPSELERVLAAGPPHLIDTNNWNPSYPCIVVSPQLTVDYWNVDQVHLFIGYLINTYKINTKRIYLTGLSLGGGGTWFYVGNKGKESYAAAIVPICGSGYPTLLENLSSTPVWAFHGASDPVVAAFTENGSVPMVAAINELNPIVKAKVTIYPGVGHDSWTRTYNGTGMGTASATYDAFEMSIYDWMFQYKKE
ncbi:hypothetical protein [Spongiimicrobium sp. 2-473A-2-J]|uniref:carboxylesterase family protein n=1 Tax=Eudoraea algarum TaxID=3417568 RepID=UPI003D365CD0